MWNKILVPTALSAVFFLGGAAATGQDLEALSKAAPNVTYEELKRSEEHAGNRITY